MWIHFLQYSAYIGAPPIAHIGHETHHKKLRQAADIWDICSAKLYGKTFVVV